MLFLAADAVPNARTHESPAPACEFPYPLAVMRVRMPAFDASAEEFRGFSESQPCLSIHTEAGLQEIGCMRIKTGFRRTPVCMGLMLPGHLATGIFRFDAPSVNGYERGP